VLSGLDDPRIVAGVIGAGAAGFVTKSASADEISQAIKSVMRGDIVVPAGFAGPPANGPSSDVAQRVAQLTRQQLRVLQMIRQGKLNKQIAFELGVGETTVKAHVSEILRKLGVSSRTQIVIEVAALDFDRLLTGGRPADTGAE
jgi:DNA-binding NarL/FixJ family response regulator